MRSLLVRQSINDELVALWLSPRHLKLRRLEVLGRIDSVQDPQIGASVTLSELYGGDMPFQSQVSQCREQRVVL